MKVRLAAAIVFACLCSDVVAQTSSPALTRQQRDLLQAVVAAVDAARSQPETTDIKWQSHTLRASDGSHYLAFIAEPPAASLPSGPALLYIRLASAVPAGATPLVERSAIREWLAGGRIDPRLLPKKGIAIGEMPIMGAAGSNTVRPPTSTGGNELKLMALDRERARQEQEDRDKRRRNELEGKEAVARDLLPFEDFDFASRSARADGTRIITRAFTAGPGDYDLFLAWADPAAPKPATTVRVVRKLVRLEPARTTGLITSSVILAESVSVRPAPYSPAEQASHPYSIGLMEIVPAHTSRYGREGNLSVAFQIINAQSPDTGMPDVAVTFRIVRVTSERESQVATLTPQHYNATTLPPGFNVRLGHPLFAAMTAPLATLPRGDYRLKITVNDRISTTFANSDADFSVIGTPASLLAEAPPLGPPFKRERVLEPAMVTSIVDALGPAAPSPALARAMAIAKSGRFVDLLVEEPVPAAEAGVRTALTGLALFSIGDASAAAQFQRALQSASAREASGELRRDLAGAPSGREGGQHAALQFLLGAARAAQNRDPDAIAAWQAAIATNRAPSITPQLLAEAYLRRSDNQRALELTSGTTGDGAAWITTRAAAQIANRREAEAVALVESHLAAQPDDQAARWLLLHAAYGQFVRGGKPLTASERERFATHARAYIDAKAQNSALAGEWLAVVSSQ